jgi:fatty acid desaturase
MDDYKAIIKKLRPDLPPLATCLNEQLAKGKILRYKIDIFSVAAVIVAVSTQFTAYWLHWPWYSLVLILILMRASHLAEHNHAHLPFFKIHILNEIIGWFMFLNCGIPLQSYREQHVRVHHYYLATPKDWTSPWSYQGTVFPTKQTNRIYYYSTFMLLSILQCSVIYLRKPLSKSTFHFVISMIIVSMVMLILALHDFFNFLVFYAVPWLVTYVHLAIASWKQHVDCEYDSVYTTAMNDLNIDSRALGFNIGYHTAHHWYPNLHWSLLEKFHNTYLAKHIPKKYYVPIWFSSWRK